MRSRERRANRGSKSWVQENSADSPATSGFTVSPRYCRASSSSYRCQLLPHLWYTSTTCLTFAPRRASNCWLITSQTRRPVTTCADLAERLSIDPSNLSKELGRLERDGLFRSEVSGRQKYFQLNREYPLFDEVRKIVAKTIGAAPVIAQSLKRIEGIDEAYLYGSFASNQQDAASDIDVLVIGSPREEVLAQAVRRLERQLGREINYTVLTPKEFGSRRARKDAFLENVWHNKRIPLIGPDEETKAAHR